jgi:hypothetical protein
MHCGLINPDEPASDGRNFTLNLIDTWWPTVTRSPDIARPFPPCAPFARDPSGPRVVARPAGKTNTALSAMEAQRRARGGLPVSETRRPVTSAALTAERASLAAQARRIETEAAPIRYVAELIGTDTDSEKAIRWLIALMVLCCDPLAIALTAAVSAWRSTF